MVVYGVGNGAGTLEGDEIRRLFPPSVEMEGPGALVEERQGAAGEKGRLGVRAGFDRPWCWTSDRIIAFIIWSVISLNTARVSLAHTWIRIWLGRPPAFSCWTSCQGSLYGTRNLCVMISSMLSLSVLRGDLPIGICRIKPPDKVPRERAFN